jgi:hypothetical protein
MHYGRRARARARARATGSWEVARITGRRLDDADAEYNSDTDASRASCISQTFYLGSPYIAIVSFL